MSGPARACGWGALLLVVLAGAWAAGAVLRPAFPGDPNGPAPPAAARPPDGPTLVPLTARLDAGRPGEYAFRVRGSGPLAAAPRLTAVRSDAIGLVRAVATADADGIWRAALTPSVAGNHRVLVEVDPVGAPSQVLTAELDVPGPFAPVPPTPSRVAEVDGYRVRLDGDLVAGATTQVFATVGRDDGPVTDLQPVDGAFGRLEALRIDDLARAPVRPDATAPTPADRAGPAVAFRVEVPSAGTYRLFLDFRHAGALHAAVFTVAAG